MSGAAPVGTGGGAPRAAAVQQSSSVPDSQVGRDARLKDRSETTKSGASGDATSSTRRQGAARPAHSELFSRILENDDDVSRETSSVRPTRQEVGRTKGHKDHKNGSTAVDAAADGSTGDLVSVPGATFAEIATNWIIPNHRQPREVFDEDELNELAASIREVGVLQPLVVRPIDTDGDPEPALLDLLRERPEARYELIMGERRLRASELAGLTSVPAIVRHTEDSDLLRDALLENLHRAQLNPLEEASAYQQLMADFGATQEELSRRIARSRPQIANTLRLLRLPPSVQRKVASGVISAGHARALLSLATPEEMDALADRIVSEGLSVRTTEELVRLGQTRRQPVARRRAASVLSPLGESLVSRLSDAYDTRVTITEGRTKGRIVIEFAGPDDLERLSHLIAPEGSPER